MRYKPLVTIENFDDFKDLKLSVDESNTVYITYNNQVQTFGKPDILWKQIALVLDKGIIYTHGRIFINNDDLITLENLKTINNLNIIGNGNIEITPSNLNISSYYQTSYLANSYLTIQSGDSIENAISKLEKAIIDNEKITATGLNKLNSDISYLSYNQSYNQGYNQSTSDFVISSEYQMSYLSYSYLTVNPGDSIEGAISKLEKAINDNSYAINRIENTLIVKDINNSGLFFTDEAGYVGVKITSDGLFAINLDANSYNGNNQEQSYIISYNNINLIDY